LQVTRTTLPFNTLIVRNGKMPQPRIPTAQLDTRGSFLRHPERKRARANEPQPTGELGDPPKSLDRDEKAAWRYIASVLPPGVAKNSDRLAMEELARLLVICRLRSAKPGERLLLKNYLTSFGMTPADRSRVTVVDPIKKPDNPWDQLDASAIS
jgi:hypothetical protein